MYFKICCSRFASSCFSTSNKKKKVGAIKLANSLETFSLQKRLLSLHTFLPAACRQEGALPTHSTDLSLPSLTPLYFYVEINEKFGISSVKLESLGGANDTLSS